MPGPGKAGSGDHRGRGERLEISTPGDHSHPSYPTRGGRRNPQWSHRASLRAWTFLSKKRREAYLAAARQAMEARVAPGDRRLCLHLFEAVAAALSSRTSDGRLILGAAALAHQLGYHRRRLIEGYNLLAGRRGAPAPPIRILDIQTRRGGVREWVRDADGHWEVRMAANEISLGPDFLPPPPDPLPRPASDPQPDRVNDQVGDDPGQESLARAGP